MTQKFDTVSSNNGRRFDFVIEGVLNEKTMSVRKRTIFDEPYNGITNMALVDVADCGELDDSSRSGYGQAEMIFSTVADVPFTFLSNNPYETVFFTGSDLEGLTAQPGKLSLRQVFYNRLLSKKDSYDLANNYFDISGVRAQGRFRYRPNSSAEAFLIQLKS